jgi:hypothetical protein
VPGLTKVKTPTEVIVQTLVVAEAKVGAKPELAVAVNVRLAPKLCAPGLLKLIACARRSTIVKGYATTLPTSGVLPAAPPELPPVAPPSRLSTA